MTERKNPSQGGSYLRNPDGSLVRREFTIQPGEPGHGEEGEQPARQGGVTPPLRKGKE